MFAPKCALVLSCVLSVVAFGCASSTDDDTTGTDVAAYRHNLYSCRSPSNSNSLKVSRVPEIGSGFPTADGWADDGDGHHDRLPDGRVSVSSNRALVTGPSLRLEVDLSKHDIVPCSEQRPTCKLKAFRAHMTFTTPNGFHVDDKDAICTQE